jgi:hypothetical protein
VAEAGIAVDGCCTTERVTSNSLPQRRLRIRSINMPLIEWAKRRVESHAGIRRFAVSRDAALVG